MTYEDHLLGAEANAWPLSTSIPWDQIDRGVAASERELLDALSRAAVIEGYLPVFIPRLMQMLWDDVDATAVLSMELYDGLKHYTALRRYLEVVGYAPGKKSDETLVSARARTIDLQYDKREILRHLTNFMCSELFAAHFFQRLSRQTAEPVLRRLLSYMARDEFRHSAGAADLIQKRIDADPTAAEEVLATAENFRHYGNDVVEVPVAEKNDFEAILALNRRVRLLCGVAPTDHLKEALRDGDQ